jgi:hypothetical protein
MVRSNEVFQKALKKKDHELQKKINQEGKETRNINMIKIKNRILLICKNENYNVRECAHKQKSFHQQILKLKVGVQFTKRYFCRFGKEEKDHSEENRKLDFKRLSN